MRRSGPRPALACGRRMPYRPYGPGPLTEARTDASRIVSRGLVSVEGGTFGR